MQTIFIQEADDSIRDILTIIIQSEGYRVSAHQYCDPEIKSSMPWIA